MPPAFKGIITMYEGMKPKDADKGVRPLDMSVCSKLPRQIAPRKMSVSRLMAPEAAERLTIRRPAAAPDRSDIRSDFPKARARYGRKQPN